MNRSRWLGLTVVLGLLTACGDESVPAAEFGANLFSDHHLSRSPFNVLSCATCHRAQPAAADRPFARSGGRIDAGYNLAGVVYRSTWWGGYERRLLDAINVCLQQFMGGEPLEATSEPARQLYEYLLAQSPGAAGSPLPMTVVKTATGLPQLTGNVASGKDLYQEACARCHGAAHTGQGRITRLASIVPEDSVRTFPDKARTVVEEKIRHGKFFNIGGLMPLYSVEVLSDQDVADLLAFLGL